MDRHRIEIEFDADTASHATEYFQAIEDAAIHDLNCFVYCVENITVGMTPVITEPTRSNDPPATHAGKRTAGGDTLTKENARGKDIRHPQPSRRSDDGEGAWER